MILRRYDLTKAAVFLARAGWRLRAWGFTLGRSWFVCVVRRHRPHETTTSRPEHSEASFVRAQEIAREMYEQEDPSVPLDATRIAGWFAPALDEQFATGAKYAKEGAEEDEESLAQFKDCPECEDVGVVREVCRECGHERETMCETCLGGFADPEDAR